MYLIFDTETTGLPKNYKAPLTDFDNWPRLVQLAWQCHDKHGKFLFAKNHVIKPIGFRIPLDAEAVHHISTAKATEIGVDLEFALREFISDVQKSCVIVGHNIEFDINIVGCELLRCSMQNILQEAPKLCTKTESVDFCNIIRNGKPKWPTLTELHQKLFNTNFEEAHNAAGDVVATTRCFLELVRVGVLSAEKLHVTSADLETFKQNNPNPIEPEAIEFERFVLDVEEQPVTDTQAKPIQDLKFTHLHVHSHYSMLDGMAKIPDLIQKCMKNGMTAMALTDHGNMYGIKEFSDCAGKINGEPKKKVKECEEALEKETDESKKAQLREDLEKAKAKAEAYVPFKPILGIEAYCAHKSRFEKDGRGWHLILLAKNKKGYQNLCKLSSLAFTEGFYGTARIDHELLEKYHEGIICSSACLGGEIARKIAEGDNEGAEKSVLWFKNLFGEDYYLEMQRHQTNKPNADQSTYVRQQQVNKVLVELAHKHNIKLIATNDTHFVEEDQAEAHDRLICLSTGRDYSDESRMRYTKQEWLKTPTEMAQIFQDIPEAITNTQEIADKVEVYNINSDPIMPKFPIPEEFGTEVEYRQKYTEKDLFDEFTQNEKGEVVMSQEDAEKKVKKLGGYEKLYRIKLEADYLNKLAWEGAEKRYGKELSPELTERITFELYIMKTMGFPGYFLIVQDYIRAAREELGVSVGPGRGSAAGSVVAYCLHITDIDPMKYDLLFERFLNPDRISLPDIDIDFDDEGRGKVLDWVTKKYGAEKVAHIITYGTMAAKSSIADVARVQKVPLNIVNNIKNLIPDRFEDAQIKAVDGEVPKKAPKTNLKNCYKYVPELKSLLNGNSTDSIDISDQPDNVSSMLTYAQQLEDTNRQIGIHACGVIIGADDLTNFAPVCTVTDKKTNERVLVTQYDGHVVESVGLIKMDFLGLKTLSIIKETLKNIKKRRGIEIDIDHIPIDDKATYELYSDGKTVGVFQFESEGMRTYLRELKPTQFTDLIAMNALYRPGPMDYIPQFIRRKLGQEPIQYDIDVMSEYLEDTYGVTVYQEQVMLLSKLLAGFTRGEADTLRKAMGKKIIAMLALLKPKFIEGGKKNGHDPKILEKIWGDWEKFASYAFNKSHAACYAWVSYQTAYLKANYPAEYMAANLTQSKDTITEVQKFMEECKASKILVKSPDINESDLNFTVNQKGEIRFGLGGIKGVGEAAVDAITREREANGKFKDIFDFVERVSLTACNSKTIYSLAIAGAFDTLNIARELFLTELPDGTKFLDSLVKYGNNYQSDKANTTDTLFGNIGDACAIAKPPIPTPIEVSNLELLNMEKELVGIYLSAHPLDPFKFDLDHFCTISPNDLNSLEPFKDREVAFGGLVTSVFEGITKTNKNYMSFTIEDYDGSMKISLFGRDYEQYNRLIKKNHSLHIRARIEERRFPDKGGAKPLELRITGINMLNNIRENMVKKLTINLDIKSINKSMTELLSEKLSTKGNVSLYFNIFDSEKNICSRLLSHSHSIELDNNVADFLTNTSSISYVLNNGQIAPRIRKREEQQVEKEEVAVMQDEAELGLDD